MANYREKTVNFFLEEETALLLVTVRDFLTHHGIESWLVGGYVRDRLLGRSNRDIDIVVSTKAMDVASEVARLVGGRDVLLDEANQVVRVVLPRADYQLYFDFSTIRGNIEDDLAHRDFTINTITINLAEITGIQSTVEVVDPFSGQHDLKQGLVRTIDDQVFRQDPVRLLRAVRLAAELGFTIESSTETFIRRDHHLITRVAAERVREELCRLLAAPNATGSLRWLDRLDLLDVILPELATTKRVEQPKEHFWDVFDHSIETVAAVENLMKKDEEKAQDGVLALVPWSPVIAAHFEEEIGGQSRKELLKLAALLHDTGKPMTKSVDESGRMRFLGHAKEGAAITGRILERLRFSARETKMIQKMIEYHLRPSQLSNDELPSHRAIYRYFRDAGDVGIDTLFLSLADLLATGGPALNLGAWQRQVKIVNYVLSKRFEEQAVVAPMKLIDGHDLIDRFGMSPGSKIGELLEAVREAQAAGEVTTREDALAFVQHRLVSS